MRRVAAVGGLHGLTIMAGSLALAVVMVVSVAGQAEEGSMDKAKDEEESMDKAKDGGGLAAIQAFIAKSQIDKTKNGWKEKLPEPPKVDFGDKKVTWKLTTNMGDIVVRLMPDVAPMHVSSTVYLTELGFYDGVVFHRIIPGFMAQGGDPTGTGRGGPGYTYSGEFDPEVKHNKAGLLSMANAGPGTDGSQFFLTFAATRWLDGKHTIFGEVVEGMRTLKQIEQKGTRPQGRPTERIEIEKATIEIE